VASSSGCSNSTVLTAVSVINNLLAKQLGT
jgi:hypothetical protein